MIWINQFRYASAQPPLVARLKEHIVEVIDDDPLEGYLRVYVADPFGNRIELMEPQHDC